MYEKIKPVDNISYQEFVYDYLKTNRIQSITV